MSPKKFGLSCEETDRRWRLRLTCGFVDGRGCSCACRDFCNHRANGFVASTGVSAWSLSNLRETNQSGSNRLWAFDPLLRTVETSVIGEVTVEYSVVET